MIDLRQGDVLEVLRGMPDNSVHMVVTSPPYYALRDYGVHGQIGLEATPDEFIAKLVDVFREVKRVLRHDGSCWVNMGDSYAASSQARDKVFGNPEFNGTRPSRAATSIPAKSTPSGLKPKDLMMMPARLAIALQADGWWLRSDIIWCKRAPMPESVTDRPTSAHEHIFLLTKSERYFYDADAVRTKSNTEAGLSWEERKALGAGKNAGVSWRQDVSVGYAGTLGDGVGANMRNFWLLSPEPYPDAHFATFPTEIPRRAIKAGTSAHGVCAECGAPWRRVVEDTPEYAALKASKPWTGGGSAGSKSMTEGYGANKHASATRAQITTGWQPTCKHTDAPVVPATVLDPFNGSGTTGLVVLELGRRYVGIELNPQYVELTRRRLMNELPLLAYGALEGAA